MDLRKALLKEHSKQQCNAIVNYIGNDKKKFDELMKLFFLGNYRITQRAAWPMSYSVRKNPHFIKSYFNQLVKTLETPGVHNAVIRNILRFFQEVEIPEEFHGRVMNLCFEKIAEPKAAPAIKAFSLTVLDNLSVHYPDIRSELKLIIEERWDTESAAFKSRGKKILENL